MYKRLLCAFALLILFSAPVNASAEEVSFSLSDVSCEKNRLFETTLCVSTEVAAFTATLTYDENEVEFRNAKAVSKTAELSVNSGESGKVKIAYLCESGAVGEAVTFTFKSADKSSKITLTAEQVIDSDSNDLAVTSLKGAEISVDSHKSSEPQTESGETSAATESIPSKGSTNYMEIPPKTTFDIALVICIAGGTVLILAVAAVAFFLGRASAKNNNNRKT